MPVAFQGFCFVPECMGTSRVKFQVQERGGGLCLSCIAEKKSEIICAVNEIGSSLLYGMQLISWCSFSSVLFTVKLRQCIICIIMYQECVLLLTASFYSCYSQPWINRAWNLERWGGYSGDIHFQQLNLSSLWFRACERTLVLLPRKMSSFWLFLSLCFFLSFLDDYQKFQFFHLKKKKNVFSEIFRLFASI